MNKPQVKDRIDRIQVNIKLPQQLHIVNPHSHMKQKIINEQQQIPQIKQQPNNNQNQQEPRETPHKIRHIESINDKGQFIDETHHSRISQNDQVVQTINRAIKPQPELPIDDIELQKIVQQGAAQQGNSKPLKHINMGNMQDKDQFNLRNSRQKLSQRKRRLSQSNLQNYIEVNNHFSVVNYLQEHQKNVPQKIVQEQAENDKKQKQFSSPNRNRRRSVHSIHRISRGSSNGGVSQEIQRMIVDQLDKKKRNKIEEQEQQQKDQNRMEEIKEQRQQQDLINIAKLEQARQKMQQQLDNLSKVVKGQIGPGNKNHLTLQKQQSIKQDLRQEKDQ